jgi:hypothetical protein
MEYGRTFADVSAFVGPNVGIMDLSEQKSIVLTCRFGLICEPPGLFVMRDISATYAIETQ